MTPFATGYAEAALAELNGRRARANSDGLDPYTVEDLAAATLTRIIEDCEAARAVGSYPNRTWGGGAFWINRQRNDLTNFPPLTVSLGEDGLIYFREAGQ